MAIRRILSKNSMKETYNMLHIKTHSFTHIHTHIAYKSLHSFSASLFKFSQFLWLQTHTIKSHICVVREGITVALHIKHH